MCGILAIIGGPRPENQELQFALDLIAHRGPDDVGYWSDDQAWLGARRLSIIDVGSRGHQPISDSSRGVSITYNGEIFNYLELREELEAQGHSFRTKTDTEVVLRSYIEWGEDCVHRFNGMWAFVIWDARHQTAFISRDRFGIKPLYYAMVRGLLAVASEPKQLRQLFPEFNLPNDRAVARFLGAGQFFDTDESFYHGISILEEAHNAVFTLNARNPNLKRYWNIAIKESSVLTRREAEDTFAELFDDSIRLRMRSDVPVGVTLSGGLDSTAVLHGAVKAAPDASQPLLAFTSVYEGAGPTLSPDERRWAREAAKKYTHVELVEVEAEDRLWLPTLERIVHHLDAPVSSPAVYPLWLIMGAAREHNVPVLLEGQGSDEYLGGYLHHLTFAIRRSLTDVVRSPSRSQMSELVAMMRAGMRLSPGISFFQHLIVEAFPQLLMPYRRRRGGLGVLEPKFARMALEGYEATLIPSSVNELLRLDTTTNVLPNLLQYGDAVSMGNSIESRVPFLDHRLVEFAFTLPDYMKLGDGGTKSLLRSYLRDAGQSTIAGRVDKKGFPTPVQRWLGQNRSADIRKLLVGSDSRISAYTMPAHVERLIDRHEQGQSTSSISIYRLLTTELWLRSLESSR